jgi:hypothetical protein
MNLEPISAYLAGKNLGTVGRSIFVNEMPTSCNVGILLMDNYYGTQVDRYLPDFYRTEYRLVVRHTDFANGKALARAATLSLAAMMGTVGTLLVRQTAALNLPRSYRRSAGGYWEFEVDMEIVFVDIEA